jgi:hypothetical protein
MKKLMIVLAVAGLVAGCASNRNTGGTSDENQMNSGSAGTSGISPPGTPPGGSAPTNTDGVSNSPQQ